MTSITSIIPSHQVAVWLLDNIRALINHIGLSHDPRIEETIYVAVIVAVALLLGWAIRRMVLWITRRIVAWRHTRIGNSLLKEHVLSKCSHIIPPLVILGLLPLAFDTTSTLLHLFRLGIVIYLIVTITRAINAIITFVWERYNERENTKNLPLGGIRDVLTGIVWIISLIIIGSVIFDKSPAALLAGLGAFAAALMLIFKDSILGFVAGVQLSQNDMLRIGDWIVVPSTIANGIVIDMSLTAVKVQNWDNTIVTLPPYTLVSTSFQNWRGMSDSGCRLISRALYIDADSIAAATPALIDAVSALPGMQQFLSRVKADGQFYDPGVACVNGTAQTNIGLFRAYLCNYLLGHKLIATDQQILVRILDPTPAGLPLQIYCYTTTAWTAYEAVQSELFEHAVMTAPQFGLRIYNYPASEHGNALDTGSQNVVLAPTTGQNK